MKIIKILMLNILIVNSTNTFGKELKVQFEKAVELLNTNCPKCGKSKSLEKYLEGVSLLETIIEDTNENKLLIDKQMKNEIKIRNKALFQLADAYSALAGSFYNDQVEKQIEYNKKTKNAVNQIPEDGCFHPEAILRIADSKKSKDDKLKALKPILDMQSIFFKAKYEQGLLLLEQGNVQKGIEALEMAVAVATFIDAYYTSISMAQVLKKYGRKDLADKIMQKAK